MHARLGAQIVNWDVFRDSGKVASGLRLPMTWLQSQDPGPELPVRQLKDQRN